MERPHCKVRESPYFRKPLGRCLETDWVGSEDTGGRFVEPIVNSWPWSHESGESKGDAMTSTYSRNFHDAYRSLVSNPRGSELSTAS